MKIIVLLIVLIHFYSNINAAEKRIISKKVIISDLYQVNLPNKFIDLNNGAINKIYPIEGRRPSKVFSDKSGVVNVAFNHTKNRATQSDLPKLKEVFKKQFNQPRIDFIGSSIRPINSVDPIILEFVSPAPKGKIYNKMVMTTLNDRLLIWTFNCPVEEYKNWKKTVDEIISSVKIFPRENIKK